MVLDTFTNTDGTNITTHSASWTLAMGYNNDCVINTNAFKSNAGSGVEWAYLWGGAGAPSTAKHWAQITINETSGWVGVNVRTTVSGTTNYCLLVRNTEQWLSRYTSGSWGGFVVTHTEAVSVGDKWKVSASGTTLKIYKYTGSAWTLVSTTTDSTHSGGGIGVCGYSISSGRGDDFDGGDIDLIVTPGSFALTGTAAVPRAARKLPAAVGSYALTGTVAVLRKASELPAAVGSFALSGTAAVPRKASKLPAAIGSFALTGTSAGLLRALAMPAASGAFVLTGIAAALRAARQLSAGSGSFVLSGTSVLLDYSGGGGGSQIMPAASAAFALSGTTVSLTIGDGGDHHLPVSSGAFTLDGLRINLWLQHRMAVDSGSFALSGAAVTLTPDQGYMLVVTPGGFLLTGVDMTPTLSASYVSVVTVGHWSTAFTIPAGAEWRIICSIDSNTDPLVRVSAQMREHQGITSRNR